MPKVDPRHNLDPDASSPPERDTQGVKLVQMALDFTTCNDTPSICVLDAFFSIGAVFELANSLWSVALKQPYLTILTRAKKSYTAYFEPPTPASPTRGRPRKYGDKVKLKDIFKTDSTELRGSVHPRWSIAA